MDRHVKDGNPADLVRLSYDAAVDAWSLQASE